MPKTILLTGANGQLGRSIYLELFPYFNVIPCIYKTKINIDLFKKKEINLDITDFENIKYMLNIVDPDIIINTAAFTNVDQCELEKEKANNINVYGVRNLLKLLKTKTYFNKNK